MGLRSLLADMGVQGTQLEVLTDATAAKQMASRTGLGTVRHIDTHYLWVQEKIKNKDISSNKVWNHDNPADLLTKHLDKTTMHRYMSLIGLCYSAGRSALTPSISK